MNRQKEKKKMGSEMFIICKKGGKEETSQTGDLVLKLTDYASDSFRSHVEKIPAEQVEMKTRDSNRPRRGYITGEYLHYSKGTI